MLDYIAEFHTLIDVAVETMNFIPESLAGQKPSPEKWCPKEILGHLIDSATNNHHRIVLALASGEVCFELKGYQQDKWVSLQMYREAQWPALIQFWRYYNKHLCRLVSSIPAEIRAKEILKPTYSLMVSRPLPENGLISLDCLMEDYVIHLKHHLRQIVALSKNGME